VMSGKLGPPFSRDLYRGSRRDWAGNVTVLRMNTIRGQRCKMRSSDDQKVEKEKENEALSSGEKL
jgi:hypothetical protein